MEPAPGNSDLLRILDFAIELDRLKAVLRKARPVGLDRYENSAEHSWHVCVLALLLSKYSTKPVDLQRVVEILLVHDVPEIDCGDHFVFTRDAAAVAVAEGAAAERIFGLLPAAEAEWFISRWREYEARETPEAALAFAADRLMPVLHNLRGGTPQLARGSGAARARQGDHAHDRGRVSRGLGGDRAAHRCGVCRGRSVRPGGRGDADYCSRSLTSMLSSTLRSVRRASASGWSVVRDR
jgi:putative hydrolase of HD superfamily